MNELSVQKLYTHKSLGVLPAQRKEQLKQCPKFLLKMFTCMLLIVLLLGHSYVENASQAESPPDYALPIPRMGI